jgi:glutamyl-tRNA reductase
VAAANLAERSREASDAETLIAGEVERFQQKQRAVNVAPAIVALQRQAEDIRQAELRRVQARLGGLSAEQIAAVEALTRGLVNKFLHPPMQALKQAAREGDQVRLEAVCGEWSVSANADRAGERNAVSSRPDGEDNQQPEVGKAENEPVRPAGLETTMETRR